jgi:hypothetical protein
MTAGEPISKNNRLTIKKLANTRVKIFITTGNMIAINSHYRCVFSRRIKGSHQQAHIDKLTMALMLNHKSAKFRHYAFFITAINGQQYYIN